MTRWTNDHITVKTANAHVAAVWDEFDRRHLAVIQKDYPSVSFKINPHVLEEAIQNAVTDIERMSKFHLVGSGPDNHKLAAFFSMWIARFRPVYFDVSDDTDRYPPDVQQVNAQFAFFLFRSFLETEVPDELVSNLLYTFHYRLDTRPEALSPIAYACEEISRLRNKLQERADSPVVSS